MYGGESAAILAFVVVYLVFIGLWWFLCGIAGHMLLKKKGYQHAGLYVLAWFPILNWMTIFLFIGLPDALLNRKVDYLLRQMAASGLIQGQAMPQTIPQPAPMAPQGQTGPMAGTPGTAPGAPATTPQAGQANPFTTQAAPQTSWQPSQNQQTTAPNTPENLFGPGSNNKGSSS